MNSEFDYILNKILDVKIINHPFPHLDIKNFLSEEHLNLIINENQIHFPEMNTDDELYDKLINKGWEIQGFPGCISKWSKYKKYLAIPSDYTSNRNPVESVGITFRLKYYKNNTIKNLLDFMNSDIFHQTLKSKFDIIKNTRIISAIQKNLTGYEISPHPDIRQKCLTYLLNINNNVEIEKIDCHTHLLQFKDEYKYVQEFWENNKNKNRCWIPWGWCNTIKTINENNSIVIFCPDSNPATLHAIRLNYNHLKYQRTQIYGNLMVEPHYKLECPNYQQFMNGNIGIS